MGTQRVPGLLCMLHPLLDFLSSKFLLDRQRRQQLMSIARILGR